MSWFKPRIEDHGLSRLEFEGMDSRSKADFDRFWAGGQMCSDECLRVSGDFDRPVEGLVIVRHRHGSDLVSEVECRREQGSFFFALELLRGRNVLEIEHVDGRHPPLRLDVDCRGALRDWVDNIVKTLILLKIIQTFVAQTFFIPSGSMENTLLPGDYIVVEKISTLFAPPRRGDIVIFEFPRNRRIDFVKRCVALAGDTVAVSMGRLALNGHVVEDGDFAVHKETGEGAARAWRLFACDYPPARVPPGHCFVMGDNREHSYDSRAWGPLELWRLKGKALSIYYPFSRFGLVRSVALEKRLGRGRATW